MHARGFTVILHYGGRFGFGVVECGPLDVCYEAVAAHLFFPVGGGNPFAGWTDFRNLGRADAAVHEVVFILAHPILDDDRSEPAYVVAYPSGLFDGRAVVFPVEHAAIVVFPRGSVDDFTVCGDAVGQDTCPELFVTVIQGRHREFGDCALRPQQRFEHAGLNVSHPIFPVGRCLRDLGFVRVSGRFRNEDIAGKVDGYLAAVLAVTDEEQSLVGDDVRLG